jgi:hypothetical protein
MMFLILEGYAELVSLPLRLEFASLLFSGESLGFFNHDGNFRASRDKSSAIICMRTTPDLVSSAHSETFKGI